jgi:hypothetical protein
LGGLTFGPVSLSDIPLSPVSVIGDVFIEQSNFVAQGIVGNVVLGDESIKLSGSAVKADNVYIEQNHISTGQDGIIQIGTFGQGI